MVGKVTSTGATGWCTLGQWRRSEMRGQAARRLFGHQCDGNTDLGDVPWETRRQRHSILPLPSYAREAYRAEPSFSIPLRLKLLVGESAKSREPVIFPTIRCGLPPAA